MWDPLPIGYLLRSNQCSFLSGFIGSFFGQFQVLGRPSDVKGVGGDMDEPFQSSETERASSLGGLPREILLNIFRCCVLQNAEPDPLSPFPYLRIRLVRPFSLNSNVGLGLSGMESFVWSNTRIVYLPASTSQRS